MDLLSVNNVLPCKTRDRAFNKLNTTFCMQQFPINERKRYELISLMPTCWLKYLDTAEKLLMLMMIQLSEIPGFIEGVKAVIWVQGLLRLEMKPKNAVFIRVCLMKRQRGLARQGKQGWGAVCYFPCKFQFVSEKLVGEETHSFPYSSG